MDLHNHIALSAIQFICGENNEICRLCLSSTKDEEIGIKNVVKVRTSYGDDFVSFLTMLQELDVSMEPLLPQVLCKNCATVLKNCYHFKKLVQFSHDKWNSIFKILDDTLSQSSVLHLPKSTGSVIINTSEKQVYSSRLHYNTKSKSETLMKVIRIMKKNANSKTHEKVLICESCGRVFKTSIQLVKHMKAHHRSEYPCPQCPKIFRLQVYLEEHAERIHYPKKIECKKCFKKFSTDRVLKHHIETEHVVVKCKKCDIVLPSKKALRVHLNNHTTHTCPQCKKQYTNGKYFKLHSKMCGLKDNLEKYICDFCNKVYSYKHGLSSHMKTEHGFGNVILCKWCNKKFDAISKLEDHIVTHTKEKKFHCERCGFKFVSQKSLINHIRLHTGEQPYPCNLCNKSFLSASRRLEHKKRTHFEPTHECSICHAKFVTSFEVRTHKQRHFNPKSKLYVIDCNDEHNHQIKMECQ